MMTTQALTDSLVTIKKLMAENKNYEVCFLPDSAFQKFKLQTLCWSDRAAIGWIAGGLSTACKDYTNVNALVGFCESVWNMVPNVAKRRQLAQRKLNTWLKKAAKYGLQIND